MERHCIKTVLGHISPMPFLKKKKERLLGTWGKKKSQQHKMKQNKNNYEAPKVKIISFKIERGFSGSAKIGDSTESTLGTQQLDNQNNWEVTWRQSAQ